MKALSGSGQEQDQYQTGEADWKSMPNGNHPAEWQLGTVRTSKIQTDSEPEQGGFFGRWKERRKKRQEEKQREYERALQMPWEMMFAENDSPESPEDFQEYGRSRKEIRRENRKQQCSHLNGLCRAVTPFF